MTLVGFLGILLSLAAWPFAVIVRTRLRVAVFALAFVAHVMSAIVYYGYVQTNAADTAMYYNDSFNVYADSGFGFSTAFILWVVQTLKGIIGGTYLDYFFLFQAIGFFGIAFFMRTLEEIYASLGMRQPLWSYGLLFLPGLHFWTSAIGKDAPLFMTACLSIWAVMQLRRRYLALAFALVLMLLVRPHIALIAFAALAMTVSADRTAHPALRAILVIGSLGALGVAVSTIGSTFGVDLTNADSVSDFLSARDAVAMSEDLGNSGLGSAPYPVKLLSFLFRPFFFDAADAFGLIASAENVALIGVFLVLVWRIGPALAAFRSVPFVRYALIGSVGITLVLAMDYYNVGLGLRQKTMVLPGFLIVFVTVQALVTSRRAAARARLARPVHDPLPA